MIEISILERLNRLNRREKLIYVYWLSRRLFHNYADFHQETGFGNIDVLLDAINLIRRNILGEISDIIEINSLIEKIEINTPHTDDFDTIKVSFALDACNALSESLRYMMEPDDEIVVDVASFSIDTVDMFIQEKENFNGSDIDERIHQDEFMKAEIRRQLVFLEMLESDSISIDDLKFENSIDVNLI